MTERGPAWAGDAGPTVRVARSAGRRGSAVPPQRGSAVPQRGSAAPQRLHQRGDRPAFPRRQLVGAAITH
jgi:hypothetical protein